MPIPYNKIPFEQLVKHQGAYDIINTNGKVFFEDWDIHHFEGCSITKDYYCSPEKLMEFRAFLRHDFELLDSKMPFLKFGEVGQHYAYELFLSPPPYWASRGAPGFWNKLGRIFTDYKLPLDKNTFSSIYLEIINNYEIPYGKDEYVNIEEFNYGGMSQGAVGGLFVKDSLDLLLMRLKKYTGDL